MIVGIFQWYLILINIVAFAVMCIDKYRAVQNQWRIPERVLFGCAILGGSIGAIVGMWLVRHKTRHWYFVVGLPAILVLQIAAMAAVSKIIG